MISIIGLISSEPAVCRAAERLKEVVLAKERKGFISNPKDISKLLGCDLACLIKNYSVWGIAIGIGIYAIFVMAETKCHYNLMHYRHEYGMGALLCTLLVDPYGYSPEFYEALLEKCQGKVKSYLKEIRETISRKRLWIRTLWVRYQHTICSYLRRTNSLFGVDR